MDDYFDYKLWKETIELAIEIKEEKPWEIFGPLDVVLIDTTTFNVFDLCSIKGFDGGIKGIEFYHDTDGLNQFYDSMFLDKGIYNENFMDYEMNHSALYFVPMEEVFEDQLAFTTDLGFDFSDDGLWPKFVSHSSGFFPQTPSGAILEDALYLYRQILNVIKQVKSGEIRIPEEYDYIIVREGDLEDDDDWKTYIAHRVEKYYTYYPDYKRVISPDVKDARFNDEIIELDLTYLDTPAPKSSLKRVKRLLILTAFNRNDEKLIYMDVIGDVFHKHDSIEIFFEQYYVPLYGKMKKLVVRNDYLWELFEELLEELDINLEWGDLYVTDKKMPELGFANLKAKSH